MICCPDCTAIQEAAWQYLYGTLPGNIVPGEN